MVDLREVEESGVRWVLHLGYAIISGGLALAVGSAAWPWVGWLVALACVILAITWWSRGDDDPLPPPPPPGPPSRLGASRRDLMARGGDGGDGEFPDPPPPPTVKLPFSPPPTP